MSNATDAIETQPPLVVRLLDWLLVGLPVVLITLGSVHLCGALLRGQPLSDLPAMYTTQPTGLRILLIVVMLSLSLLTGTFLDKRAQPLTIFAPLRFLRHAAFGIVMGLLIGIGVFGFFWASYQSDEHNFAWYVRDVYSLLAAAAAYWLVYQMPQRLRRLSPA